MKYFSISRSVVAAIAMCIAAALPQSDATENAPAQEEYDAALAQSLGADDYGMRSYVLVILHTGPADITDETRRKELFAGHFASMARLAEEKKLVLAGPLIDGGEKRGLYVFDVADPAAAESLVMSDPAVEAGIFAPELIRFYGSAALLTVGETHRKIQKKPIQ